MWFVSKGIFFALYISGICWSQIFLPIFFSAPKFRFIIEHKNLPETSFEIYISFFIICIHNTQAYQNVNTYLYEI